MAVMFPQMAQSPTDPVEFSGTTGPLWLGTLILIYIYIHIFVCHQLGQNGMHKRESRLTIHG